MEAPNKCPKCKSEEITYTDRNMEACALTVQCEKCGVEWYEHYTFKNIEIIGE